MQPVSGFPGWSQGPLENRKSQGPTLKSRNTETYYAKAPLKNPPGPSTGGMRVLRGGSWLNDDDCPFRCANRDRFYPDYRHFTYGFRCVRNP